MVTSPLPVNWACLSGPQCSVYVGRTSQAHLKRTNRARLKLLKVSVMALLNWVHDGFDGFVGTPGQIVDVLPV